MSKTTVHSAAQTAQATNESGEANQRRTIEATRQADYVAFLHRHPWATDAYELGFVTGVREDYRLRDDALANVDVPILMLDNDFTDPDLDRYLERFHEYEPDIAVLGDAYTAGQADQYLDIATRLYRSIDEGLTLIIAPKCREAFDRLTDEPAVTLGFAMGSSEIHALDFTDPIDWRGQDVHLLGASPPKQFEIIQKLTQPTISGDPPANIVGADWNGIQKVAYKGETWTRDGWTRTDHLSIRESVRRGLREIKAYWQERGIWPDSTPTEEHRPAVQHPDDQVFVGSGEQIRTREALEDAVIVEYGSGHTLAYESEAERDYVEHRHGCPPSIA